MVFLLSLFFFVSLFFLKNLSFETVFIELFFIEGIVVLGLNFFLIEAVKILISDSVSHLISTISSSAWPDSVKFRVYF